MQDLDVGYVVVIVEECHVHDLVAWCMLVIVGASHV